MACQSITTSCLKLSTNFSSKPKLGFIAFGYKKSCNFSVGAMGSSASSSSPKPDTTTTSTTTSTTQGLSFFIYVAAIFFSN